LAADLLEPARDAEPVQRPERIERLEDHQVERALEYFGSSRFHPAIPR
jgi:hypothetical protein